MKVPGPGGARPHGHRDGRRACAGAVARRRAGDHVRLARQFRAALVGGAALGAVVVLLLPETLRTAGKASLSPVGIVRGFVTLWRHRAYRVYVGLSALAYGGLFSFISGSSFVLQGVYGLGEIAYSLSFTFPVLGFIAGTVLARRLVLRLGFDGTIGVGVACLRSPG